MEKFSKKKNIKIFYFFLSKIVITFQRYRYERRFLKLYIKKKKNNNHHNKCLSKTKPKEQTTKTEFTFFTHTTAKI